jgi:hypothetical protein
MDPDYWVESAPATGDDLDDIYCALGEQALREEASMLPVPTLEPSTPDRSGMLDDMRQSGYEIPEAGSTPPISPARAELDGYMSDAVDARIASRPTTMGPPIDPAFRPGPTDPIVYPPWGGARGREITRGTAPVGEDWNRIGSTRGTYFSPGDPPVETRSLPPARPRPSTDGRRVPTFEERDYRVAREFPEERSIVGEWFGEPGGATQVQAPMSARALEAGGYLEFQRELSVYDATPDEIAEIDAAVAEEEAATRAASLREPISPDMATMCDDIAGSRASDAAALESLETVPESVAATVPATTPATSAASSASGAGAATHEYTAGGRLMGALGAAAGAYQMYQGGEELRDGDLDMGLTDVAAGGVGAGTGLAATGLLGDAAAAACAAPPVALGAALVGAAATGHHYNEEHGVFGTDDEGHNMSSFDFALANGSDAYHGIHDAVASIDPDSDVADGAGMLLGGIGGTVVGAGAGIVGLGGDLANGVPEAAGGLYDLVTGYGDEYIAQSDVYGEPTVDEHGETHHVGSREFIEQNAHGSYDAVHDGITGLTGTDGAMGVVGEVAGTTLGVGAGALVGLGAGVIGAGGAIAGTVGHAAEDFWSWMAD